MTADRPFLAVPTRPIRPDVAASVRRYGGDLCVTLVNALRAERVTLRPCPVCDEHGKYEGAECPLCYGACFLCDKGAVLEAVTDAIAIRPGASVSIRAYRGPVAIVRVVIGGAQAVRFAPQELIADAAAEAFLVLVGQVDAAKALCVEREKYMAEHCAEAPDAA